MTPSEQDKEISEKLAELYPEYITLNLNYSAKWLINDWHQIMELAVANAFDVLSYENIGARATDVNNTIHPMERYSDHNNDKSRATRYAIGRALIAIKEQV